MTSLLTLTHGSAQVQIAPATGGALTSFTWRDHPILRPTAQEMIDQGNVRRHACYPLVPYSNRIAHGLLTYGGEQHQLALNFGDHPHSIHGVGWQRSWQVLAHDASSALLQYEHTPAGADHPDDADRRAWPWPFRVTQWFSLGPDDDDADTTTTAAGTATTPNTRSIEGSALRIRLALTNTGTQRFPFGLGWHPFFPRFTDTMLGFTAKGVWETDATVLPTTLSLPTDDFCFDPLRRIGSTILDNIYTGWPGEAVLDYPAQRHRVVMRGDTSAPFFVVYVPPEGEFLAIEPVTQMTDAFNLAERGEPFTGTRELGPGEAFSCTMEIKVRAFR